MLLKSASELAELCVPDTVAPKLAGTGGTKRGGRAGDVVVVVVVGAAGVDVRDEFEDCVTCRAEYTGGGRLKMSSCSSS